MNFRKNSGITLVFSIIVIILTGLIVSYDYAYAKNIDDFLTLALTSSREVKKMKIELQNNNNSNLIEEISYNPNFTVTLDNNHNYTYTLNKKVADLVNLSVTRGDSYYNADKGTTTYSLSLDLRRLDNSDLLSVKYSYNLDLLNYVTQREKLKLRIIRDFYDLISQIEEYKVLESSCERWKDMLNYSKSRYELGLANKIDYLNAEVNLGQAQNNLLRQSQSIETAKEQFLDLIGYDVKKGDVAKIDFGYDIKFEPMNTASIMLIKTSPSKEYVREDYEAEKVRLKIAEIKYNKIKKQALPKLKLNLSRTEYENKSLSNNFSSMVTYDFNLGPQSNKISEWIEKNNYELRNISLSELDSSILIEQRDIVRKIDYLEKAYEIAAKNLTQAEENYEFSKLSFQKGMISNIDLRDAQEKLTSAKRNVISLIIQHKVAKYQFYYAMGKDL